MVRCGTERDRETGVGERGYRCEERERERETGVRKIRRETGVGERKIKRDSGWERER